MPPSSKQFATHLNLGRTTISTSDVTVDESLTLAAARFFPNADSIEFVSERTHMARVARDGRYWLVRRWPVGVSRDRIEFVQRIFAEATKAELDFLPTIATTIDGSSTIVEIDGRLFDAQSWLPGNLVTRGRNVFDDEERLVNRPAHYSASDMTAAVRAIAAWHESTRTLAQEPGLPQSPLDAFLRTVRSDWERLRQSLLPIASRTPHIQRWLRTAEIVFPNAVETLAKSDYLRANPPVIGHLNLWPSHLLFSGGVEGERVTGLLDFSTAAVTSPVIDLAQLIAHFNGWTGAAAEELIGAYAASGSLAPEERRLLPAVAGLDLVSETGRLLTLGHATKSIVQSGSGDTVRSAAAGLLLSLEAIAPAVERGDRPEPSKAKKWVHKERKGGASFPARTTKPRDRRKS